MLIAIVAMIIVITLIMALVTSASAPQVRESKKELDAKIQKKFEMENLDISQQYISVYCSVVGIDETKKKICFLDSNRNTKTTQYRNVEHSAQTFLYSDILESEVIIDGETVTRTSRASQVGGALTGAVLAGGVGAIIGGLSGKTSSREMVEKIQLKIIVNDTKKPVKVLTFLDESSKVDKNDMRFKKAYEQAMHWHSLFKVLIENADKEDKLNNQEENTFNSNVADEIRKLYSLLEEGIITQEEFDMQKKKIISI